MTHETVPIASRSVGEIIEASTTEFVTQCHRLYEAPPLGSLVRSRRDNPIYGIVGDVATHSFDPGRRPMALGEKEDTEEAVYERNPQLNRLLTTEFRSITVGYRENGELRRYLAPLPPNIHSFVYRCDQKDELEFSGSLDFLSILLASNIGSADDVTASFLRQASRSHPDPQSFLLDAGKGLATLLSNQLQRLNGLLKRLSQ